MSEFQRTFHVKPGAKSSEFWLAVVVVIASLVAALDGRRKPGEHQDPTSAIAIVAAALTAHGYTRGRSQVKSGR